MARKILISLVSDQTIPNILLIKDLSPQDCYFFLTTAVMESDKKQKTDAIIKTAGVEQQCCWQKREVLEDNFESIKQGIESFQLRDDDEITVNITGGTKPMSLATYEYFKTRGKNVKFLYKSASRYEFIRLETAAKGGKTKCPRT